MKDALKYLHLGGYGLYLGCTVIARLVPLPVIFVLGQGLGALGYFLLRKRRKLAVGNIRIALGLDETASRQLARRHFVTLGANLLAMLKTATMSDAQLWRHITFDIAPEIAANPEQKGCVAVLSHMSNWELPGRLGRLFPGHQFGAIYQKLANSRVNRHFNESRARQGVRLFDRQEGFWNAVSFLESGGVLGVLADQFAGVSGTWMPFFGRLTSTSTLAAALAHRVGVDLVPVVINTTGLARWHVSIGSPLVRGSSPEAATAAINRELENQITACPADWLWSHDRWKTPRFGFLLSASNRRVFFPPGFDRAKLKPYQILVRSVDDPVEAKLTIAAVRAIKLGRPDARVTVVAAGPLAEMWRSVAEVDEVLVFPPDENPWVVAKTIARAGRFDVGILLPANPRPALEMLLAGVPYRLGPPGRLLLNFWRNAPGFSDPEPRGAERYRRIAGAAGAALEANGFPCGPASPTALPEADFF